MTTVSATAIVDFIAALPGLDRLQRVDLDDRRPGAIDLLSGQIIEPSPDFPEGDVLLVERANGQQVLVHSFKLVDALILRAAQSMALSEGGNASGHYDHLKHHLKVKTGFGY